MKTKEIVKKLESLFGKSRKQKTREKRLESINGLINILEKKQAKVQDKLDDLESQNDIPRFKRKLNLAEMQLVKARKYKADLELESL